MPTAFNVPFDGSTKVACFFAFRALLLDTYTHAEYIPQNEGSFRPVKVTSPLGSIFNPIAPAAAEARFSQIQRLVDLIIKALAPVLPDKCTAGNAAVLSFASYSGVRPNGDYWVFLEVNEAAMGGRPLSDGPDTVEELMRNTRNNPLEDLGMHLPLICDRYEVRDDMPPGAGKFRGGAGVVKSQRYLTPGFMTHESDRNEDAPWGIFGGKDGACSKVEIRNTSTGKVSYQPAKFSGLRTEEGDVVTYYLAVRRRLRRSAGARPGKGAGRRAGWFHHGRPRARRLRRGAERRGRWIRVGAGQGGHPGAARRNGGQLDGRWRRSRRRMPQGNFIAAIASTEDSENRKRASHFGPGWPIGFAEKTARSSARSGQADDRMA